MISLRMDVVETLDIQILSQLANIDEDLLVYGLGGGKSYHKDLHDNTSSHHSYGTIETSGDISENKTDVDEEENNFFNSIHQNGLFSQKLSSNSSSSVRSSFSTSQSTYSIIPIIYEEIHENSSDKNSDGIATNYTFVTPTIQQQLTPISKDDNQREVGKVDLELENEPSMLLVRQILYEGKNDDNDDINESGPFETGIGALLISDEAKMNSLHNIENSSELSMYSSNSPLKQKLYKIASFITGIENGPTDITSINLSVMPGSEERLDNQNDKEDNKEEMNVVKEDNTLHNVSRDMNSTVVLIIERKVPIRGYMMVAVATLAQASCFVVSMNGTDEGEVMPALLLTFLWQCEAALLIAIPLAYLHKHHHLDSNDDNDEEESNNTKKSYNHHQSGVWNQSVFLSALGASVSMWICQYAYHIGSNYENTYDEVALFGCLGPIFITCFQLLKTSSFPNVREWIGLIGSFIGIWISMKSSDVEQEDDLTIDQSIIVTLSILSTIFFSIYTILMKYTRNFIPAPIVHVYTHSSLTLITLLLMILSDYYNWINPYVYNNGQEIYIKFFDSLLIKPFDRQFGIFGFLYPSFDRLGAYLWFCLAYDTLGTLGYSVALQYVNPMTIVIGEMLQTIFADLMAFAMVSVPIPSLQYIIGGCFILISSMLFISIENDVKEEMINCDNALKPMIPEIDNRELDDDEQLDKQSNDIVGFEMPTLERIISLSSIDLNDPLRKVVNGELSTSTTSSPLPMLGVTEVGSIGFEMKTLKKNSSSSNADESKRLLQNPTMAHP